MFSNSVTSFNNQKISVGFFISPVTAIHKPISLVFHKRKKLVSYFALIFAQFHATYNFLFLDFAQKMSNVVKNSIGEINHE